MNEVIPFGKYRGQEIAQIKQRDPAYVQWLMQQAWFKERFSPIYQIVVNNFAPPSEETPAHNALQVQFLEFDFRVAFLNASTLDLGWDELAQDYWRVVKQYFKVPKNWHRHLGTSDRWVLEHRKAIRKMWSIWPQRHDKPEQVTCFGKARFENISDVYFEATAVLRHPTIRCNELSVANDYKLMIEIKPSMGDDYPAVLRQMKRQKEAGGSGYIWFLLVDQFASQAVTLEQVRQIFGMDNITIVMMSDVREALIVRKASA